MERAAEKSTGNTEQFLFIGEHAALDFANTLMANNSEPVETYIFASDVLVWLEMTALITKSEKSSMADELKLPAKQAELLDEVRSLRTLWKHSLERLVDGREASSDLLSQLNRLLWQNQAWQVIDFQKSTKAYLLYWKHAPLAASQRILALLASQIAEFLATAKLNYLRRCAGPDCVLFFYDTTKSHRRQWCSMAICGNRHKVAKFRAKSGLTAD